MLPAPWFESSSTRKRAFADPLNVDGGEHGGQMGGDCVGTLLTASQPIVSCPDGLPAAVLSSTSCPGPAGDDPPLRREELQPVVLQRIVAGGDLDPSGRFDFANEDPRCGRRGHADIERRSSRRLQACLDGMASIRPEGRPSWVMTKGPGGLRAANAAA